MSVYVSMYLSVPFHVIFLRGRTGVDRHSSKNWCGASATRPWATRPSYYTRGALKQGLGTERPSPTRSSATRPSYYTHGALKTRGGCRVSIAHVSILLHAWSPKNKGWVQRVHRPRVHRPRVHRLCVHLITRMEP